jgi:Glyoxalase superfamily protein
MPSELKDAIPILRMFSVERAKEFYVGFLGFAIDWEHRFGDNFPLYAQISRSGLRLHLSEHHGDATPGSTVFIWMCGIADFTASSRPRITATPSPASRRRHGMPGSWRWPTRSATACASASPSTLPIPAPELAGTLLCRGLVPRMQPCDRAGAS